MPPGYGDVKVDFGLELVQKSCEGDDEKSHRYGDHGEANNHVVHVGFRVTQARDQYLDEGDNTASNTANGEVDIEDVEEADLGVLTAGEEEPEIEPETENNYRQKTDCHHEEEHVTRICARKKQLGSI